MHVFREMIEPYRRVESYQHNDTCRQGRFCPMMHVKYTRDRKRSWSDLSVKWFSSARRKLKMAKSSYTHKNWVLRYNKSDENNYSLSWSEWLR